MKKKEFKAESKKLLNLMINSIYTNKEIFLRELISNGSDAIDKLYFMSLTDKKVKLDKEDFFIKVDIDKDKRILTVSDNGIGMNDKELEENLGTIAQSGSLVFKEAEKSDNKDLDIIGQFGVGFYSAFMVSDKIEVTSKKFGDEKAYKWVSSGEDGYSIEEAEKDAQGTIIKLHIKKDTDDEEYSKFLDDFNIQNLIKKYSDYIKYPIKMDLEHEHEDDKGKKKKEIITETVNSMIPLWKRDKKDLKDEDYNAFYMDKFYDFMEPLKVINTKVEGNCTYNALLFIPAKAPYDYYSTDFERGLELYSNGVLIMEKCKDLLPDYFSFVKGLVDTPDVSLNISREMLQQDKQLKVIAKNIESKIKKELEDMQKNDREKYEAFFKEFGIQLKYGIYAGYGNNKDLLKDLIMFHSSEKNKLVTLKEYVDNLKEGQDKIYYACGESVSKINLLPQVEAVKDKGYEVLYLTEYVDEFAIQIIGDYEGKKFANVSTEALDIETEEEKKEIKKNNEDAKDMFAVMKEALSSDVKDIRFTKKLKDHPVCLSTEGQVSVEMEKVINAMPTNEQVTAEKILEINADHKVVDKLKELYKSDKEELKNYAKVLYAEARLIEGLPIDNPAEISSIMANIMAK